MRHLFSNVESGYLEAVREDFAKLPPVSCREITTRNEQQIVVTIGGVGAFCLLVLLIPAIPFEFIEAWSNN